MAGEEASSQIHFLNYLSNTIVDSAKEYWAAKDSKRAIQSSEMKKLPEYAAMSVSPKQIKGINTLKKRAGIIQESK